MPSFIDEIDANQEIAPEVKKAFRDSVITKFVPKGQILLSKHELSSKAYYVLKGCLRSYSIDEKGKEHIFMFAPEGWTIADIDAQTNHTPSELIIDAIEDSEVQVFNRNFFAGADAYMPHMNAAGMKKLFKRISVLQKRIIMLMSATALERYEDFLVTYPEIVQRVPQKMIASYLGITPEALSKIRGMKARQK